MKKLIPFLILVLVAAAGFGIWWYVTDVLPEKNADESSGTPAPGEEDVPETVVGESVTEVAVEGSEYSFSPKTITVKKGATVKLTFKNIGNTIHTWTIDELDLDTGSILPGSSKTIEFDAVEAGTYEIYCSVSGHKESGMVGTLKIE
ncbi:hypothetical protein A2V54_01840 [candidate division WWE3 bacterium RBG_19FT_COMBO_53_11]|uniref:EfeO-type cupredoxin-like domain-containing protein n=1 Tax=candidate division WWE3 bacterium RBG_19FT_COMBO_53_11 TaxID=1802613 RepID=A0A1F4UIH1_UNCKA|nr:MAG: hypothetical protein A2V54_01840 [candidate division WWE3 bacterium RBG_19FT_COMBO_53_11]